MASVVIDLKYKDLEHLLETDDGDVGIRIGTAVVEEFTKRKLIAFLKEEQIERAIKEVRAACTQAVEQEIRTNIGTISKGWSSTNANSVMLIPAIRDLIRSVIVQERDNVLRTMIDELLQPTEIEKVVKEIIASHVSGYVTKYVRAEIEKETQRLVAESMQRMFNVKS